MAVICPGYVGIAEIDGTKIRCTDFNVNPSQSSSFYDHVIGLNDTVPGTPATKGENIGVIQTQKRMWRPSPISISGGITFPATEDNIAIFFNHVKLGTYFDINFTYHKGSPSKARLFKNCRVNSFSFSSTASDILNISAEVMAMDIEGGAVSTSYTDAEKHITWDKIVITSADIPVSIPIQSFNFTVNNNLQYVYSVDPNPSDSASNKFLPRDLRVGMQEVTGDMSVYLEYGVDFINQLTGMSELLLTCPGLTTPIFVVFQPRQLPGAIGPVIRSIPFVGVDKVFGPGEEI